MQPSELPKKLIGSEEERAVSPVIGVILMVAITVILAAVIAAFVLDIGPGDSTLSASADLSVENLSEEDEFDVHTEITAGGGDLDGVALVNENGVVVGDESDGANTGGTVTFEIRDAGDEEFDSETFSVYGYSGSVDDSIDDANANVNFGSVDNPEYDDEE